MNPILIKVTLPGQISGCVKQTARQKNVIKLTSNEYISKMIVHSDREETPCYKLLTISEDIVDSWVFGKIPDDARNWKKLTPHQKILHYVKYHDEGFGVSFEEIN